MTIGIIGCGKHGRSLLNTLLVFIKPFKIMVSTH